MGVKVRLPMYNDERIFETAHDWYVTDERVLQIYQDNDGDREFVIAEYNEGGWESVEYDPLPIPPQPEPADVTEGGKYDENGEKDDV